jgi:predicted dehydrogenase
VSGPVIALFGYGGWAPNVLRDLRGLGCEVLVADHAEGARARAREAGVAVVGASAADLPAVDGSVVCTPSATHAAVAEAALALGGPVFVEKPLTVDPAAADRLLAAAPDRIFVMDKWRYHHGVEALRDVARSGELGAVRGIVLVRDGRGDYRFDSDTIWRHVPHDLAIALEVLGALPPARHAVAEVVDGTPLGLQGWLGADDGPWATIAHSATAPLRRREARLCCTGGTAWLEGGYDAHITVAPGLPGESEPERREVSGEWPLLRELRAFVEHLGGGPPPRSSAAEAARAVHCLADLRRLAGLVP